MPPPPPRRFPPRIGHGYDLHRLEAMAPEGAGRPFVLGGVRLEHDMGPVGHSDGDVVYHAVTDAILGALGREDIGQLFPDDDPANEAADSTVFVSAAVARMSGEGYEVGNLDITVICQAPKIAPHKNDIRRSVANALGCDPGRVNLKGKTHEGVDAVGEGRAVEAHAVILLEKSPARGMRKNALWHEAASMAARAHRNQVRKDVRWTPYFSHPARVALTVAVKFGCTDEKVLAAALLHDVLEDTLADYDDLTDRFGDKELAVWVALLSKDMRRPEDEKEDRYHTALAQAPWQPKLIKLADVYDNLSDAPDNRVRGKMLKKAEHALGIVGDEPELQEAARAVRDLVEEARRRMSA
jgi:2-C-methyl-D-erythritol 2,4-cyclodiphosphate synthase